jgi:hypothetical protein
VAEGPTRAQTDGDGRRSGALVVDDGLVNLPVLLTLHGADEQLEAAERVVLDVVCGLCERLVSRGAEVEREAFTLGGARLPLARGAAVAQLDQLGAYRRPTLRAD